MSATLVEDRQSLLSAESKAVVEATAAVVAEHAEQITARFYPAMFAAHPELLRLFNQGNQATGEQSRALAASVVAYAVQLIDPAAPSFAHVMKRIAYKHISLGIRPEQYTIVGHHLLGAVGEVLGEAVTPEIGAAWNEVYWLFATQLIAEEARLYQQADIDRPARNHCAPTASCAGSRRPPMSSPSCWNRPTAAACRRSPRASTCRCSSTCRTGRGSPVSTRSPRPRLGTRMQITVRRVTRSQRRPGRSGVLVPARPHPAG